MIVLSGADLVLPSGVESGGTIVIEGERIAGVGSLGSMGSSGSSGSLRGHLIVPGFVDVHVHGIEGIDSLDGADAIARIAARLPKYGVTAFCPTTVACPPAALKNALREVAALRLTAQTGARVLPAHLESNFISAEYKGAQPADCLRSFSATAERGGHGGVHDFDAGDILAEIAAAREHVGIVTLAPELDGAPDVIRQLVSSGHIVSLGHSAATLEQARAGIAAGARHATHLFNRMPPLGHREPGLAGAVLTSDQVAAEIICDGVHVHPHMIRLTVGVKGAGRIMAITDAVAASGLPEGSTASLGGRRIRVHRSAAYLDDGTLAGSTATMDRVFRFLVRTVGLSVTDASHACSTTPAAELARTDLGRLAAGCMADFVVMDGDFNVKQTYIGGQLIYDSRKIA